MELPKWYQKAVEDVKEGRVRKVNLREEKFTLREWLWGIFAYLRFWNKKFHLPYQRLTARKALILMRLRGERPMTVEEAAKEFAEEVFKELLGRKFLITSRKELLNTASNKALR